MIFPIISLNVRNLDKKRKKVKIWEEQKEENKGEEETPQEDERDLDTIGIYSTMINGILPEDIRVNGYAEVQPYFDARFSCLYREYKYFFNLKDMNLEKMKLAADKLIGCHDFRNFCQKYDEENFEEGEEQNFIRRIFSIKFLPVFGEGASDHLNMYV